MNKNYKNIIKNLPECLGILGRNKYFNASVLVPFLLVNNELHLLFEKRAGNIRQGSEISFPGGGYDPLKDKDFSETALRETCEELGISKENISIDGRMHTLVANLGAVIEIFLGFISNNNIDSFPINKKEVEFVFSIPLDHFIKTPPEIYKVKLEIHPHIIHNDGKKEILFPAEELQLPERYHNSWSGKPHDVYVYKTDHGIIWGITAEIITELVALINK